MEYRGEIVLAIIDGRIHPFEDKEVPDEMLFAH